MNMNMNQPRRPICYPSARVVDNIATMLPRIIAAKRAAKQARHLTKPGQSATHFEEP